jgi:ParB family chromosome partitioning protein
LSALLTLYEGRPEPYLIDARQASRPLTDTERRELVVSLHAGAVGSWDWDRVSSWDAAELQGWGMDEELLNSWGKDYSNLKGLVESEEVPDFQPVGVEEQGRLDQKKPVECPNCGHEFTPK